MELKPSEIFYSQDSIMNKFGDYTSHGNTYIGETLDQLLSSHCNVNSIPTITVGNKNGKWFTSDNRRLWVFRKAEDLGFLKTINVYVSHYLNEDKFTTVNNGTSIRVRGGGPGGSRWRSWRSISSNAESVSRSTLSPSFSQPYQGHIHTREHSPPNYSQTEESYHSRNRDFIYSNYSPLVPPSAVTRPPISSTETRFEMYRTEPSNRDINQNKWFCIIL